MPCLYGKIRTRKQSAKKRIKTGKKMESTSFWNPESSTRDPESTACNPESKTALDSLTWGEQTYFRSSLLSTHFGEEKRRAEIRLCPLAREQQGSLEEYRTWDKSTQQKSRNISRYIIKSRNITLIIFFASGTIPLQ